MLAVVGAIVVACSGDQKTEGEANTEADAAEWTEMDDFHMIMAETFHPYKDSANLEPVKKMANELAASAEKWAAAKAPSRVDNDDVKNRLAELKQETASLVQLVQEGDDEAIGNQLTKVHDLFHVIQESWYENDHHNGHHHQH